MNHCDLSVGAVRELRRVFDDLRRDLSRGLCQHERVLFVRDQCFAPRPFLQDRLARYLDLIDVEIVGIHVVVVRRDALERENIARVGLLSSIRELGEVWCGVDDQSAGLRRRLTPLIAADQRESDKEYGEEFQVAGFHSRSNSLGMPVSRGRYPTGSVARSETRAFAGGASRCCLQ